MYRLPSPDGDRSKSILAQDVTISPLAFGEKCRSYARRRHRNSGIIAKNLGGDRITARLLAEMEDERVWKAQFESTTDAQCDR
ncbi:hypothetical protein [Nostoc sp.]|uniref:hypothetical protein n=1 Tax=Nostoc sp. TaxID=1180 RepID=UPI002FF6EE89